MVHTSGCLTVREADLGLWYHKWCEKVPHTQVFALPGLELLLCQELQDGLTFPWEWKPEQAQLTRAAAVAQDGQLAMVNDL